jgi:uncharacterized membrane protein
MGRVAVGLLFVSAGVLHFVYPKAYRAIVPRWLPARGLLVAISGVCEIAGGIGVVVPGVQRAAGLGLVALLIAVFPANVQMLIDARAKGARWPALLMLWLRLPVQPLLALWVWRVTR